METAQTRPQEIHALLIEDDDVDRERLVRMLRRCAQTIRVQEAPSKSQALTELYGKKTLFSFVFLDFQLEDGDGRDLLPDIWESIGPDCVVVAVTGNGSDTGAAEAIKLGIHEYLSKLDLTSDRVARTIEEGLKWREMREDVRRTEEQLRHRSLHDPLTDLHNRHVFLDRLNHTCLQFRRDSQPFAVLMIDLDRFKEVNDQFGHAAGDRLLIDVANRLRSNVRDVDTVARLGGDEFAILLDDIHTAEAALTLGRKLVSLLERPFAGDQGVLRIGASVGVALCPQHGSDPSLLLRRADNAMYRAKRGVEKVLLHDHQDAGNDNRPDSILLLGEIEQALEDRQFTWFWQPKLRLRDGALLGFEALARWPHPQHGMVPPDRFIGALEQSPLLPRFTAVSIDTVLAQTATVADRISRATVSINISARMLGHPSFVDDLLAAVQHHGIAPQTLMLELTETALLGNPVQAARVVERLHKAGVALAVDDFGAGFTSFSTLREFRVQEIKIDKSYILTLGDSRFDRSLVRSLVVFCESLDIALLAEGVETETCRQTLIELGCTGGQGFGLCHPLPFAQIPDWIRDHSPGVSL